MVDLYTGVGELEVKITEGVNDKQKFVVYQALYGDFDMWIRPFDEFMGELDKDERADTSLTYRFNRII